MFSGKRRFVEEIETDGREPGEIVSIMLRLPQNGDVVPEEVPKTVSLRGASISEVVFVNKLYYRELEARRQNERGAA